MNESDATVAALSQTILDAACKAGIEAKRVENLKRLSGGASKETWAFDIVLSDGSQRELVLRREPPGRRFMSQGLDSLTMEAAIVKLAGKAGVPVPAVPFELPASSPGGDGYAMDRIEGETIGVRVLKLFKSASASKEIARQCGSILARIHSASGYEHLDLNSCGSGEALVMLEERHRETGQDRPVFEFALRWLKDNLPEEQKRVLLHGDFRNGNLIVGPEGIRAVLDWELAHVGPPAYDLAWLCVPSWRFQKPELPVGGFGTREELMAGYIAADGTPIDPAELFAWEVFQILNWGVMCAGVAKEFMEGSRTIEGGAIARRASETEFDLMRMLAPDHVTWNEVRDAG